MSGFGVVLDACVLIPMPLCDTLLRAAGANLFRLTWSEEILEEVRENLIEHGLTDETSAQKRISTMRQVFPEASVGGFHGLLDSMTVEPKDRHVLAAAVAAGAQVIVTYNLRHFPEQALGPYNVEAQSPDDFLLHLYDLAPATMIDILRRQPIVLRNPPMTTDQLLDKLSPQAPQFAARIEAALR